MEAAGPEGAQIRARQILVLACPPAVAESSPGANPGRAVAVIWNVFAVPGASMPGVAAHDAVAEARSQTALRNFLGEVLA